MTLESFENWTLCLARTRVYLSFVGLSKNTANGKEACQDDRVQVCLLPYLLKELLIFSQAKHIESLPVDFRLLNCVLRSKVSNTA